MNLQENLALAWRLLPIEFLNTLYMVFGAAFFAVCFGLPLGTTLFLTQTGGLKEKRLLYRILSGVINIGRSIPFAILIIAIIPFTRFLAGTSIGTSAALVPLTLAAIPFFARIVENALNEIEKPLIEAAIVMGASTRRIVLKVLLPESLPALIAGITLTLINLIGYSAMAGLVGGGGLGKVAIQYGYQRFNGFLMLLTLLLLILLVELIQRVGERSVHTILLKRGRK
jgi:D-methionine transport system permease protein